MCLKWQGGASCTLLDAATKEVTLPACPTWLVANADAAGYYHVRYDAASLDGAQAGVRDGADGQGAHASVGRRARPRCEQGTLPLGDALGAPARLPRRRRSARASITASGSCSLLNPRELDDKEYAAFGRAVQKLLGAHARTVGWAPKEGEDPEMSSVRPQLLGDDGAHCARRAHRRRGAQARRASWLKDRKAVAPDMVGPVLGIAALSNDAKLFDRMLDEARHVQDRRERAILLGTLGGFRSPALRERALALVTGSELDQRETIGIVYRALFDRDVARADVGVAAGSTSTASSASMREDEAMRLFGSVPRRFATSSIARRRRRSWRRARKTHAGAPHELDEGLEGVKTARSSWHAQQAGHRRVPRQVL